MAKGSGFKMKGWSPFTNKNKSITPEMMQQLDDQIIEMKKLGNKGALQVLLDKKSKIEDEMTKS